MQYKRSMGTTRYTMDIDQKFDNTLNELAESKNTSKADIIKRAVATYKFFTSQTDGANKKVSITDDSDKVIKDVVIP